VVKGVSQSPQKENGYTAIANTLMEALSRTRIPGEARQVLDFVLRKTYGFNKKSDKINLAQFCQGTGLKKPTIIRAINKLLSMNMVVIKKDNAIYTTYSFNKHYTTWKPLSKKITVIKKDNEDYRKSKCGLSKKITTIITKVDSTKVDSTKDPRFADFSESFHKKAKQAEQYGFNIYMLINTFYKKSKLIEQLPEKMLATVLDEVIHRNSQICDPFPYFMKVLKEKSCEHFSSQAQESNTGKRDGFAESIHSILNK